MRETEKSKKRERYKQRKRETYIEKETKLKERRIKQGRGKR